MLKARTSVYGTGRQRGAWWKWKIEPYSFDAVMLYAQPGHGRRSNLYTDYTFGVWRDGELVPVAKAYSGLSNSEISELDRWIRAHTVEKFGPVRSVEPTQVFELAYEGIAESTRHKSGIALRFPRILRRRPDKPASEADTLQNLQAVLEAHRGTVCVSAARSGMEAALTDLEARLAKSGRKPFEFQREAWRAYLAGESGLINAPTGTGKTLAAWLGPLVEAHALGDSRARGRTGPRVLWITPLRALANDLAVNLRESLELLDVPWTVEVRTGDTSSSARARQRTRPPDALVITPESVSVLLSYGSSHDQLRNLSCVIVDEWHELLGTKRGVLLELTLAHLRALNPQLRIWGLSATLPNLPQALVALLGAPGRGRIIRAAAARNIVVDSVIPSDVGRFPWAGHMGSVLVPEVIEAISRARTTLLFTNTRAQAEIWYRHIVESRLDWLTTVALHHGSIDRKLRTRIEQGLKSGELRCVVCTSSLDLGVDFPAVDQVIQVGSPKGIGRLMQRAGRSGHRPGETSRILCVPTHAWELVEIAAARSATSESRIEARRPLRLALDVLIQHLVTLAAGPGFDERALQAEVRDTHAYSSLSDAEWRWAIDFVTRGGTALQGYPQFRRVSRSDDGLMRVAETGIARRHRMAIGTISSDAEMQVKWANGSRLGTVEESFISRLKPGDDFGFAGRVLRLIQVKDMTAYVRASKAKRTQVPRWQGGRLPLSVELADAVLEVLGDTTARQDPPGAAGRCAAAGYSGEVVCAADGGDGPRRKGP